MMQKIGDGNGFIAALGQSGGSTPRALKNYGVEERLVERRRDVRPCPPDARAHYHLALVRRGQGDRRHPAEASLFKPLVVHPRVLRALALSGGFSREEACLALAKNRGMIASFSRALLSDLRHDQSDAEFDRTLGTAIDEIYEASTEKVPA